MKAMVRPLAGMSSTSANQKRRMHLDAITQHKVAITKLKPLPALEESLSVLVANRSENLQAAQKKLLDLQEDMQRVSDEYMKKKAAAEAQIENKNSNSTKMLARS